MRIRTILPFSVVLLMTLLFVVTVFAQSAATKTADAEISYAQYVKLKHRVTLPYHPRPQTTAAEQQHITELIHSLADTSQPDIGYTVGDYGYNFAPLPGFAMSAALFMGKPTTKTDPTVIELVRLGPKALPAVLEHLEDATPTKLQITSHRFLQMKFERELSGNPMNPFEKTFLAGKFVPQAIGIHKDFPYTVTVGDICFVILGQIVEREYSAVRYQPSGIVIVNSPVLDPDLRNALRKIWSSNDPQKHLFNSLLTDFSTEGIFNGDSLDGWDAGSNFQIQAALRLLFYYPAESVH